MLAMPKVVMSKPAVPVILIGKDSLTFPFALLLLDYAYYHKPQMSHCNHDYASVMMRPPAICCKILLTNVHCGLGN